MNRHRIPRFPEEESEPVSTHQPIEEPQDVEQPPAPPTDVPQPEAPPPNRKVFITHGSNRKIVNGIKDLLELADFEPVIAIEQETTAEPIPHKIREGMQGCKAGIIHVGTEHRLRDEECQEHTVLNPNVLIEIGAAMALYKDNFILLVEKGIDLPSNLQGLAVITFEGDEIDLKTAVRVIKSLKKL